MVDRDTFLTKLYVMIDDFCQSKGFDEKHRPGPAASLSCSEVVTVAVFGQWAQFPSEEASAGHSGTPKTAQPIAATSVHVRHMEAAPELLSSRKSV